MYLEAEDKMSGRIDEGLVLRKSRIEEGNDVEVAPKETKLLSEALNLVVTKARNIDSCAEVDCDYDEAELFVSFQGEAPARVNFSIHPVH